jgi:mannose-6-phosphate isomerase
LFDWNRVGADGQPRPLHIEQSLEVTHFGRGPVALQTPELLEPAGRERLVACEQFVLERRTLSRPQSIGGDDRFHLLAVLEGQVHLGDERFALGETCLLPAAAGARTLVPEQHAVLLDIFLP